MIEIKINNTAYTASAGETILDVAQRAGIHIPTMCWLKDFQPSTSCMVCLVQDIRSGKMLTSCSALAENGMNIITENDEISDMRKSAIELLLSEHYGDCEAPCQRSCPAGMDIPAMNRLIAAGDFYKALVNVSETIALPSILGYICPAPCEKACRRKDIDKPVAICQLKRFVGENEDLFTKTEIQNNISVAIIGAGPAGLAAAFYAVRKGYACDVFDDNDLPGGKMRTEIPEERLPREVLDAEIAVIRKMGVTFYQNQKIDSEKIKNELSHKYQYIILATGAESFINFNEFQSVNNSELKDVNILKSNNCFLITAKQIPSKSKMAVRAAALGRKMCEWMLEFSETQRLQHLERDFNSAYRRISGEERSEFLKEAENHSDRIETATHLAGFTTEQARMEAKRCLHCDCRKKLNCRLRDVSTEYKASQRVYFIDKPASVVKNLSHQKVIFEKQKCIKCGLCIQTAIAEGDNTGFAFRGRGFEVEIAIPIEKDISVLMDNTAIKCAINCPTGAIALRK